MMARRVTYFIGFFVACSAVLVFAFRDRFMPNEAPFINGEQHIIVVIPSYNNSKWYQANLGSVFRQSYSNYRVIYIDDCSNDNTSELVTAFVKRQHQEHRVDIIKNQTRKGKVCNVYHAIHSCDNRAIIVLMDGDDWLNGDQVFKMVNRTYCSNPELLLTYGQFQEFPGGGQGLCRPMPEYFIASASYRKQPWITSHLWTFRAGLFNEIRKEDLMYGGEFYPVTGDQAIAFPMLEMANGRIKFIDHILYIYNQANPINDFKVRLQQQLFYERVIRRAQPYPPLSQEKVREFCAV